MKQIYIIFLIILFCSFAQAEYVPNEHITYIGTTDGEITVAWDSVTGPLTGYEISLFSVERQVFLPPISVPITVLRYTLTLPYTGHFIVYLRSVNGNEFSPWNESTDPTNSLYNGSNRSWWIYGYVAPPGPIIYNSPQGE